jgi:tight adherence protein B
MGWIATCARLRPALAGLVAAGVLVAAATPSSAVTASGEAPALASTGPLGISWMLWLGVLAIFFGLIGVIITVLSPPHISRHQSRVDSIEAYVSAGHIQEDAGSTVSAISASLVQLGDKVMDSRKSTPRTQQLLERADLPFRAGEWAVLRAFAVVVGMAGGVLLMHGSAFLTFVGACLGGLAGVLLPAVFLKVASSHRAKKFEAQLPDVLTLVASSLSTGFSLLQALDAVARDASEPSAKEFSRALAETRIGADLTDSLDHLADRMDSNNLRWTSMAIDIQRQVGGNLAETLRTTAATLRDRQALSRHVKALSAEGRLSAYILIALPIGIFLYMLMVNRPYVQLLWTRAIGIGMMGSALISMTMGVLWMNKVVKVEV